MRWMIWPIASVLIGCGKGNPANESKAFPIKDCVKSEEGYKCPIPETATIAACTALQDTGGYKFENGEPATIVKDCGQPEGVYCRYYETAGGTSQYVCHYEPF